MTVTLQDIAVTAGCGPVVNATVEPPEDVAEEQRQMQEVFDNTLQAGKRFYLVSVQWFSKWRSYLADPDTEPR